jgi:hypothetical protein
VASQNSKLSKEDDKSAKELADLFSTAVLQLKPKAQKKAMETLRQGPEYVPKHLIEEVVREVKDLPEEEQATVVEAKLTELMAELQHYGKKVDEFLAGKKIRDINPTAFTLRKRLGKLSVNKAEELITKIIDCREYLNDMNRKGLIDGLTKIAGRYMSLADQLNAPPLISLTERAHSPIKKSESTKG